MMDPGARIIDFAKRMAYVHPELDKPVTWAGFCAIAQRCGIFIRILGMSHPARLVRLGNSVGIQIKRGMARTLQTRYGMHELWHFWNDDIHEACIYADEETVRHPREDAADMFAWYVTSPARIYLEPRRSQELAKARDLTPDLSSIHIHGSGRFLLPVVGESFCEGTFLELLGPRRPEGYDVIVDAALIPENDNRHDPKAVRVEVRGKKVGYLSRSMARRFRMRFARRTVYCRAKIIGGWDRGNGDAGYFGVRLDL